MKTLADLKRDAKKGNLLAELIIRCGDNNIPEQLKGYRGLVDANSNSLKFLRNDGKISSLDIQYASLVEYDENTLIIYYPGLRDLNQEEKSALNEWKKITETEKYKKQSQDDAYTDGSSTYYQERAFFSKYNMLYLMGCNTENGIHYEARENKIRDKAVKGEIQMKYNLKLKGV